MNQFIIIFVRIHIIR